MNKGLLALVCLLSAQGICGMEKKTFVVDWLAALLQYEQKQDDTALQPEPAAQQETVIFSGRLITPEQLKQIQEMHAQKKYRSPKCFSISRACWNSKDVQSTNPTKQKDDRIIFAGRLLSKNDLQEIQRLQQENALQKYPTSIVIQRVYWPWLPQDIQDELISGE